MPSVPRETSSPPGPDFAGLTDAQRQLLSSGGWAPGRQHQPRPQTVRKLLDRGLLVARPVVFMGVPMQAYDVPSAVRAAWCAVEGVTA